MDERSAVSRREGDPPLVEINVPCFLQLELARRSIDSILSQSFQDFELTLLDDGRSEDYRHYAESLTDRRVRYHRNSERLGAMGNMFRGIYFGASKYTLAFHEDDVLGKHYLETAVDVLENRPECGFVAAQLRFFETEPGDSELAEAPAMPRLELLSSGCDFLRSVMRGIEPMFGSIVYRRTALEGVAPRIEELGTLSDRPFLLDILRSWSGAIVKEPLAFCRLHGAGDDRHASLTPGQVLRFLRVYRGTFPPRMSAEDRELFSTYTGYWIRDLHRLIPVERRPALAAFYVRAWLEGIYDPCRGGAASIARRALRLVKT
jgi:hypothetical protein